MDEYELAERAHALPDRFADRLEPNDLATVRQYADVGEWGEKIDLLLATLRATHQSITAAERSDLLVLLKAMGLPTDPVQKLSLRS
jgi:hypothetical protein